jgi:Mlc titration factor MtfA (ptsG expression regulator)/Tfp pilus assembly protein PilF
VVFGWFRSGRRKRLLAQPLPEQWRACLTRNVAIYSRLSPGQQRKLVDAARIIAAERRFVGCKGLEITDEIKLTIAAQAALLLLGEDGYYFERVTSFLVYPYKMILPAHGVRPSSEEDDFDERVILGQAFQQGEIILSWPDVLHGGRVADDGENVVLHELAHHLDGLDGQMGGSPPGLSGDRLDHFHRVFETALAQIRRDLADGVDTALLPAASESTTELFAYATECFFERPHALQEYGELFECLQEFYKVDPRNWFDGNSLSRGGAFEGDDEDEDEDEDEHEDEMKMPASADDLPALESAEQYFARGLEFFELGQWELAAADFNRCVRTDPTDQEALVWRGRAYLYQDHLDSALADADRACRLDSEDAEAHALRAMCLAALARYREALEEFARAGNAIADDAEALFLRGIARSECGDASGALADIDDVIQLDPDDAEAWHERGRCNSALGHRQEAERDFAKARELGWSGAGEGESGSEGEGET